MVASRLRGGLFPSSGRGIEGWHPLRRRVSHQWRLSGDGSVSERPSWAVFSLTGDRRHLDPGHTCSPGRADRG